MSNVSFAIHPAIGIARVGDSKEFFYAPEVPGLLPDLNGEFKDKDGAVKKQVARFRVFRFEDGKPAVEVQHGEEFSLTWRVHVANRKGAWYEFQIAMDLDPGLVPAVPRRNGIHRQKGESGAFVIDGGKRILVGSNQRAAIQGRFVDRGVFLGEARTDEKGRLEFRPANGKSESVANPPADPTDDANNDGFYDDTCDGTIRCTVRYRGQAIEAEPAFVISGPPNFCQGIAPVVSMYDVIEDLFVPPPQRVEFWRDVYPILEHLVRCEWVNEGAYMLFGAHSPANFTHPKLRAQLADPRADRTLRKRIFDWFRNPANPNRDGSALPPFYGDGYEYFQLSGHDLSLTKRQYECLRRWADGDFVTGREYKPVKTDNPSPDQLDRAALEDCLGGPFHPGIELPWILRRESMWKKPFRLRLLEEDERVRDDYGEYLTREVCLGAAGPLMASGPGTVTRWMAVPWQTDAVSCHAGYIQNHATYLPLPSFWSARVPNFVLPEPAYKKLAKQNLGDMQRFKHFSRRQIWFRDVAGGSYNDRIKNAVTQWNGLGIVAPRPRPDGCDTYPEPLWIETGRAASGGDPDLTLAQMDRIET